MLRWSGESGLPMGSVIPELRSVLKGKVVAELERAL
jgi:hypothetical protein